MRRFPLRSLRAGGLVLALTLLAAIPIFAATGTAPASGTAAPSTGQKYDTDANIFAGKLTYTPSTNHTLVLTAFGDPTTQSGWLGLANSEPGPALRLQRTGSYNGAFRYNGILSPKWLIEASIGRHHQRNELEPDSDTGRNVPRQVDETITPRDS